jgi:hypothetical protein
MLRVAAAALALVAVLGASSVCQTTRHVPAQYKTIQAGIDAATNGDTVLVAPGTYRGSIDFLGKQLRVVSEAGAAKTTIEGTGGPVVEIDGGVGRAAVLQGFTVRGGSKSGIYVGGASPSILDCRVEQNSGVGWCSGIFIVSCYAAGGGIYLNGSNALIARCEILNNSCSATGYEGGSGFAYGGGIYATGGAVLITGCYVGGNWIFSAPGVAGPGSSSEGGGVYMNGAHVMTNTIVAWNRASTANYGSIEGGGIYGGSGSHVVNCNVWGNSVWTWPAGRTAGVARGIYTNCIIRENTPTPDQARGSISHCNVEGSVSGPGNFDADPRFTPGVQRLRWDSPCRDAGIVVGNLPTTDFEGHPRIADGKPDVGLDELYVRLVVSGSPRPGGQVDVKVIGEPGMRAFWAVALTTLAPPLTIPGLQGELVVDPAGAVIFDLGPLPASGEIRFRVAIPNPFPVTTVTMQALVRDQLSLAKTVTIQ